MAGSSLILAVGAAADSSLLRDAVHWSTKAFEIAGVLVIVLGSIWATVLYARALAGPRREEPGTAGRGGGGSRFHAYRSNLGRAILLGLEFLVAADIINTVAITPTMNSVLVLGMIVLIRTFLSFSLEVEIEGRWPWRRAEAEALRSRESQRSDQAPAHRS